MLLLKAFVPAAPGLLLGRHHTCCCTDVVQSLEMDSAGSVTLSFFAMRPDSMPAAVHRREHPVPAGVESSMRLPASLVRLLGRDWSHATSNAMMKCDELSIC